MVDSSFIDSLFSAVNQSQSNLAAVAKYSVSRALQLMNKRDYAGAVKELKKAVGLDPSSEDAYGYLGMAYLKLNKTKEAVDAYKNQIRVNPISADAYNSLGNAYLQAGSQAEAEKAYKTSARIDGSSTYAPYTLGNMYVQSGRLAEAEKMFRKVTAIAPKDAHGFYGLALVANKQERYAEAISYAEKAVALKKDFAEPHFELGAAYLALGKKEEAQEQKEILDDMGAATLSSDLQALLRTPKMVASLPASSTFKNLRGAGTLLSSLDPALMFPNTSKDFTMTFQFDSQMDAESVTNIANWSISKASGGRGGLYNNGVTLHPETQVTVPTVPRRVTYDAEKMQATVYFTLSQNSAVNAQIDPSHIVFKFSGTDATGKKVDSTADEVDGFGGLPF